jgi:hypothetical protein
MEGAMHLSRSLALLCAAAIIVEIAVPYLFAQLNIIPAAWLTPVPSIIALTVAASFVAGAIAIDRDRRGRK